MIRHAGMRRTMAAIAAWAVGLRLLLAATCAGLPGAGHHHDGDTVANASAPSPPGIPAAPLADPCCDHCITASASAALPPTETVPLVAGDRRAVPLPAPEAAGLAVAGPDIVRARGPPPAAIG